MTMCNAHDVLLEARLLQRYTCGNQAPRFALRRYLQLLPASSVRLPISLLILRNSFIVSCFEPLPFLPRSTGALELERRLYLTMLVTEATPWGATQSAAAAATGVFSFSLYLILAALLEVLVLPLRTVAHIFFWLPRNRQ